MPPCAEDIVPRLLASPEQSPEQVAAAAIAALQPEEAEHIGDEFVESTLEMFEDIFDAVTSDDPLQVPSIGSLYRTLDSVPPGVLCDPIVYIPYPGSWLRALDRPRSCIFYVHRPNTG